MIASVKLEGTTLLAGFDIEAVFDDGGRAPVIAWCLASVERRSGGGFQTSTEIVPCILGDAGTLVPALTRPGFMFCTEAEKSDG